jgi:hypothetical protein
VIVGSIGWRQPTIKAILSIRLQNGRKKNEIAGVDFMKPLGTKFTDKTYYSQNKVFNYDLKGVF